MRKKLGAIAAAVICVIAMGVPVCAQTTYLDVKAGDTVSLPTTKDGGSNWDNYFYVSPATYYGTVYACSSGGGMSSSYYTMYHTHSRYSYGSYAPSGVMYHLYSYGSPSGWHLTGNYTS